MNETGTGDAGTGGQRALKTALHAAVTRVFGPDHGILLPAVGQVEASSVPATGPSFGVKREGDALKVGIPQGPLLDAVLTREACLAGFPVKARKRDVVQHACSWVAWRLARGAGTRKAFWNAWARQLLRGSTEVSLTMVPPVLLAEINKVRGAKPLVLLKMLRTAAEDAEALTGRITGMNDLIGWVHETVASFTTTPDPAELATCLSATRLFVATGQPPSRDAIAIDTGLPRSTFSRAFAVASTWLTFPRSINIGSLDHVYVMVACTSALPATTVDALLDIPGMTVRLSVARGELAGHAPGDWHTMLATFSVPVSSVDHVLHHVDALQNAGLLSTVDTWILDATTTAVNFNRYDPATPAFSTGAAGDASTDDPQKIVASTVDFTTGRAGARAFLDTLPARRPATFLKLLEAVQSPFTLVHARYGGELARLAATCGARKETIRDWLESKVHRIAVPHPRAFHHVLPFNPGLSSILVVTSSTMTRAERSRFTAPFLSWQANELHPAGEGKAGTFWQLRAPSGSEQAIYDHVRSTVPRARCGFMLVPEVNLRHFSFLPWFDYTTRRHLDTGTILSKLTGSAVEVTGDASTLASHARVVQEARRLVDAIAAGRAGRDHHGDDSS